MVYGAAMYFSVIKLRRLERRLTRSNLLSWVLIVYMTILFALCTIYMGTNIQDIGGSLCLEVMKLFI
jgi:hypothetical protein